MAKTSVTTTDLVLLGPDVKKSVKSIQLSKKYVKRLVKISILNIIYRRINVPQDEFVSKSYEAIPYMIFKRKSENKFIRSYHTLAYGVVEAIEKDYLKEISMYILQKGTKKPLETYNLKIKYNKGDTTITGKSEEVKEATKEFITALSQLPGKKWKEEDVELFMELTYNEDTPKEYEPPHFEAAREILSNNSSKFVSLGSVNTGFHKVSAWGRGPNFDVSRCSTPATSIIFREDNQASLCLEEPVTSCASKIKKSRDLYEDDGSVNLVEPEECSKKPKKKRTNGERSAPSKKGKFPKPLDSAKKNQELDVVSVLSSTHDVNCLCAWNLGRDFETVNCSKCFELVHLICHGFLNSQAVEKENFKCVLCSKGNPDKENLIATMKLRATLYGIKIYHKLPDQLYSATRDEREFILYNLDKFGIRSLSSKSAVEINFENLDKAINQFFQLEKSQYLE